MLRGRDAADGDHGGSDGGEGGLRGEGGAQHPAARGEEEAVEAAEEEGAEAEGGEGGARFDVAGGSGGIGEAEGEVDRVALVY